MRENDNEETEMFRCLKCGCSRTDTGGFLSCVLCGAACGTRTEECLITDDTKAKLLGHSEDLKSFGVTLTEEPPLHKSADTVIGTLALVLGVAESLHGGVLRKLILYLHELAISKDEILRLRLTEPEEVEKILTEK
jgi:hypothetical protein